MNTAAACLAFVGVAAVSTAHAQSGIASVYGGRGEQQKTANGETTNANALTAASKTLPLGTHVRVTNKQTGKSVVVRINDRGPYVQGRIIDLMPAAARAIGFSGLAPVNVEVVGHAGGHAVHRTHLTDNTRNRREM
ncbi:MAG: septal ring lytic transglycosylase RlpA family protein [Bradyrhizobiaceae bacterium]|nr:septal ring lytic transglycosylase RlpA family protein [Bradyrhizobiaceae bacterium]